MVAGQEIPRRRLAFDEQARPAAEDDDPFVGVLRQPFARRRDLTSGDDALHADARRAEEDVDALGGQSLRKIVEKVAQAGSIASQLVTSG